MKIDFTTLRKKAWSFLMICYSKIIIRMPFASRHLDIAKVILFLLLFGTVVYAIFSDEQAKTSILVASIAAWFAYLAYRNSLERLRLDLLDKRWAIYENVLKFSSLVMKEGGLPELEDVNRRQNIIDAIIAAHEGFRGIGYHKAKSLFGPDIDSLMNDLNKSYSFIVSYNRSEFLNTPELIQTFFSHLRNIMSIANRLPEIFKRYVYFGDYTSDRWI